MPSDVYYDKGGAVYNVLATGFGISTGTEARQAIYQLADDASKMDKKGKMVFPSGDFYAGDDGDDTLVIPEGVSMAFVNQAKLHMWDPADTSKTCVLVLQGTIEAGLYTVFPLVDGTGAVVNPAPVMFSGRSTPEVYPEWFGAVADDPNVDCSAAISAAMDSLPPSGGVIRFTAGDYRVQADLKVLEHVTFAFDQGARLQMWKDDNGNISTYQLLMRGKIAAESSAIVDLSHNPEPVVFGDGTNPRVYPEWFGARAANFVLNQPGAPVAGNVPDSTEAIKAAVASLPLSGGEIRFSPGQYGISDEIVIDSNGVLLLGGPRQGPLNTTNNHGQYGSMLVLKGDLDTSSGLLAMVRFTEAGGNASWGCGVKGMSFCDYPGQQLHECEAAVHVEKCIAFTMEDCTFTGLNGAAIKVSDATRCHFGNVQVVRCGSNSSGVERPAVWLVDGEQTQGTTFLGFKVEVCHDVPYFYVGDTAANNKLDDLGFEADPAVGESLQTFLVVRGKRTHVGKAHFNRASSRSEVPKMVVEGIENHFGELSFHGQVGEEGSLYVKRGADDNHFDSVILGSWLAAGGTHALPYDYETMPQLRVYGDRNQFGKILFGQDSEDAHVGRLVVRGKANQLSEVIDRGLTGVHLAGGDNRIVALASIGCPATALRVTGTRCEVLSALLQDCAVEDGPVLEIGPDTEADVLSTEYTNQARVRARVLGALHADEGILVTGDQVELLPGTVVRDIRIGHGLRWTGERGSWHGVEVSDVGKTGYYVEGGTPTRMTAWSARRCNLNPVGIPGQSGHGGFLATTPAHDPVPATCTDFVIEQDGASHAFSFKMKAAGTGGQDHDPWLILGNVSKGGPVEIPTSLRQRVDLDSEGQGKDVASASTITLGDSANFFVVTGSTNIDYITASWPGRLVVLRFNASGLFAVKDDNNIKLNGPFSLPVGQYFTLTLICDGTNWIEVSRSANP